MSRSALALSSPPPHSPAQALAVPPAAPGPARRPGLALTAPAPAAPPDGLAAAQAFDAALHASASRLTSGLSPIALGLMALDWGWHWATQPAQASRLLLEAQLAACQALADGWAPPQVEPDGPLGVPGDHRFEAPAWRTWPWAPLARGYQLTEAWWARASALRGMSPHHQEMARVLSRQWLDTLSPANAGLANPEVVQRTLASGGSNLAAGWANALDDWRQRHGLAPLQADPRPYQPGVDVAITPGRVVHRNALVELTQYSPSTPDVQAEPVFIVPSWIMKYYILDLSPENSMVKWLVGQGHTVFIVSWRNPDEGDALLDMADYLRLGVLDPLAAIGRLVPGEAVQACGYCLGGTLLAIAAAALARPARVAGAELLPALASVSLLAAETDFSEPGEMGVLIDESQVALIEDMMAQRGFLSGPQMAGSFQFLHARDLVWSAQLRELWLGERLRPNDLMAWNADTTRMPAAMHSEYLRRCYLHNELAQARYPVEGQPVALADIHQPLFVVGTEKDHVSPWPSVYKLHRLTDTELTFVLTSGGHNAGIVSEPGHPGRHHAVHTRAPGEAWCPPEQWPAQAVRREGSWWPTWHAWLQAHGSGRTVPARQPVHDEALGAAPGRYVLQRYED